MGTGMRESAKKLETVMDDSFNVIRKIVSCKKSVIQISNLESKIRRNEGKQKK